MSRSKKSVSRRRATVPARADSATAGDAGESLGAIVHPYCVACSSANARSLGLKYIRDGAGSGEAEFDCPPDWEGYPGIVHGGMVALIVDSAMTNCLFASGQVAMTAELTIRYHATVQTNARATVRAGINKSTARLHVMEARIIQGGKTKVTATGKFLMGPLETSQH